MMSVVRCLNAALLLLFVGGCQSDEPTASTSDNWYERGDNGTLRWCFGGCLGWCSPTCFPVSPKLDGDMGPQGGEDPLPCKGLPAWQVNPINLNLLIQDIPLWYDAPLGPSPEILLSYNSEDNSTDLPRPFGPKWSFNYESQITEQQLLDGTFTATVTMPHGRRDVYRRIPRPDGQTHFEYTPPAGYPGYALIKKGIAHFELSLRDGPTYVYQHQVSGPTPITRITAIRDRTEAQLTLHRETGDALTRIEDAQGLGIGIEYTDGLITEITGPFGRKAAFRYQNGELTGQTDMGGTEYGYSYVPNEHEPTKVYLRTLELPSGTTEFYIEPSSSSMPSRDPIYPQPGGLMGANHRITVTDPMGSKEEYYYQAFRANAGGNPVYDKTPIAWHRDKKQYLLPFSPTYADGPMTRYRFAEIGTGEIQEIRYADGTTETFNDFTASGLPQSVTGPNGVPTLYEYNDVGRITRVTDQNQKTTTYTFTEDGKDLTNIIDAEGTTTTTITYEFIPPSNINRRIKSIIEAPNQTTHYHYRSDNLLDSITDASDVITRWVRDPQTLLITEVLRETASVTSTVEAFVYETVEMEGQTVTMSRVHKKTDSAGLEFTYEYDGRDRITKVTRPDGTWTAYAWGCCEVESTTDSTGRTTKYIHDKNENTRAMIDAEGRIAQYSYDPNGNLTKLLDGNGNVTEWTYDEKNRLAEVLFGDGLAHRYEHDDANNEVKFMNARGSTVTYTHKPNGDPSGYHGAGLDAVEFEYDDLNRLTLMRDGQGETTFDYDDINRTISVDGPMANDVIVYTYDELWRLKDRSIDGVSMGISYDHLGRVDQLSTPLSVPAPPGVTTPPGAFVFHFRGASDHLDYVDYPNGQRTTYDYYGDPKNQRLKEILHTFPASQTPPLLDLTISHFRYDYDRRGNINEWTSQTHSATLLDRYSFQYDQVEQLIQADLNQVEVGLGAELNDGIILKSFSYFYDQAGNRSGQDIDGNPRTYHHNELGQRIQETSDGFIRIRGEVDEPATVTVNEVVAKMLSVPHSEKMQFEAEVDLRTLGADGVVEVRATDAQGHVRRSQYRFPAQSESSQDLIYDDDGNLTFDGDRAFEWDALSRLTAIVRGLQRSEFAYDGLGRRVRITEKENGVITSEKRFLWCGFEICEERDGSGTTVKRFFPLGVQYVSGANTDSYFYTTDHLGSVRALTDVGGDVLIRYDYDPFGTQTEVDAAQSAPDTDFGFQGMYHHAPSGLNLTLFRAYDPAIGRWLSRDPIGIVGGLNQYVAFEGNGIMFTDPTGLRRDEKLTVEDFNRHSKEEDVRKRIDEIKEEVEMERKKPRKCQNRKTIREKLKSIRELRRILKVIKSPIKYAPMIPVPILVPIQVLPGFGFTPAIA